MAEQEDSVLADLFPQVSSLFIFTSQTSSGEAYFTSNFDLQPILLARFPISFNGSMYTYVGTIASSNDQSPVEHKLHVASTGSLSTRGGDMFAQIGSRAKEFSFADIIVFNKDDLEQITDIRILVDNLSNGRDETDDGFSLPSLLASHVIYISGEDTSVDTYHPVSRSSLATKDGDTLNLNCLLCLGHLLQGEVSADNTKDVHLLAFILMDSLDLNIEQSRRIHNDPGCLFDVLGQADLVLILDVHPFLLEFLVIGKCLKPIQLGQVLEEVMATELLRDKS